MNSTEKYQEHKSKKRTFIGLIFIIVGTALIAKKASVLPENISDIVISWKMLLIAIGAFKLYLKDYYRGLILISIGTFFLLPQVFDIPFEVKGMFWPAIFVVIGVLMITVRNRHRGLQGGQTSENYIDLLTFMSGGKRKITSQQFLGGKITSIFGGNEIDLTAANIKETIAIDVFTMFGGVEIVVPRDWDVQVDVTSIFGGFNDKRGPVEHSDSGLKKVLIIKGFTIFGGGEVKSY